MNKSRRMNGLPSSMMFLSVLALVAAVAGCGDPLVIPLEEIKSNETAFVIPLEGNGAGQEKFASIEYLRSKMVVSKRIEIPVRKYDTGYGWWGYKYIPTVRVVKVDRSLVTREWSDPKTSIAVESKESINFHVGVNLTALVSEEDASTYLYYHTLKPLSEVVDANVRGFLQGELSKEFGVLSLEDCKAKKGDVFSAVEKRTVDHFKVYGITIQSIGSAGGLSYDDPKIQEAINATANAEMSIEIARKEKVAQDQKNEQKVAAAIADRRAAEEFAKAQEAQVAKVRLDVERMRAEAMLEAAKRWNGAMPASVLPQGSPMLFGLDTKQPPPDLAKAK